MHSKSTVVLNDLCVGQIVDFVLEADIWIEKPAGSFNNIATHHLKSHGDTCKKLILERECRVRILHPQ